MAHKNFGAVQSVMKLMQAHAEQNQGLKCYIAAGVRGMGCKPFILIPFQTSGQVVPRGNARKKDTVQDANHSMQMLNTLQSKMNIRYSKTQVLTLKCM